MSTNYRYRVYLAPGCHNEPFDPEISRHRSLSAALDKARRNDRLYAEDTDTGERWQIPAQGSRHGPGRFGGGITPSAARDLGWDLGGAPTKRPRPMSKLRTAYVVCDKARVENWGIGWTREEAVEDAADSLHQSAEILNDELDHPKSRLIIIKIKIDAETDISGLYSGDIEELAFG